MKKVLLFLFVIISALAYSQDTTQIKTKKEKRFFIGANFSADLCSGVLATKPVFDNIEAKSIPKFGFTSGVNACYILSKKVSINVGVQYSQKNYDIKTNLTFGDIIDRRRGFVYSTHLSNENRCHYLDIPLMVNFVVGKHKTHFVFGLGVITNIFLKATSESFVVGGKTIPINLSPTVSAGINYTINNRMFFRIEPTFRFGILQVSSNLATQYIWSAGLNCSYYFGL